MKRFMIFSGSAVYDETRHLTYRTAGDTTSPLSRKPFIRTASGITVVRRIYNLTNLNSALLRCDLLFFCLTLISKNASSYLLYQ